MKDKILKLKEMVYEICDINSAIALLSWDQQTYMPRGGAGDRSFQTSTLSHISHIKSTSRELGNLIGELKNSLGGMDPDSDDACLIRVAGREYDKKTKVPAKFVSKFSELTAMAQTVWEEAREKSDFKIFQPCLEKIVEMRREYTSFFPPSGHIYDILLDDFEPGLKTADVKKIFEELRKTQVELIRAVSEKEQINDSFLHQNFDERKQWDFGVNVISRFGFDWKRGRQDKSAHPFTTGFGLGDTRITTRFFPDYLASSLFSSMHECGHALYEQGIDRKLDRTFLGTGASLAVHESQSRLWENIIGRSMDFWIHFYPGLKKYFPSQLSGVSLQDFYRGINRVRPSLIRVESDEATYNLHIMLRLELEIGLMDGTVAVKDLPEIWNAKMKEYLGVSPENDAEGVLQDVHWSGGSIGYFPTYALGNLISAQIWECMERDISGLHENIRNGKFEEILQWLREKLHRHGSKFEPQEIVKRVTGSEINPAPYLRYLDSKYKEIYGII